LTILPLALRASGASSSTKTSGTLQSASSRAQWARSGRAAGARPGRVAPGVPAHHPGHGLLAEDRIVPGDQRGLGHVGVQRQRAFHLGAVHRVAAAVDEVLDAVDHVHVAVAADRAFTDAGRSAKQRTMRPKCSPWRRRGTACHPSMGAIAGAGSSAAPACTRALRPHFPYTAPLP
jgi:hypothetical protein